MYPIVQLGDGAAGSLGDGDAHTRAKRMAIGKGGWTTEQEASMVEKWLAPGAMWMRDADSSPPVRRLSRQQIVIAAIAIADGEGAAAVSIRRIARELGVGAMSLYRHVPSKDDLLDLMFDQISGEGDLPAQPLGDWRVDLRLLLETERDMLLRHPWAASLGVGRPALGPNALRRLEFGLAALGAHEPDVAASLALVGVGLSFVYGFAQQELAGQEARRRTGLSESEWQQASAPYVRRLIDSGEYPFLQRVMVGANLPDDDASFAFGLERVLDGISLTRAGDAIAGRDWVLLTARRSATDE